MKGKDKTVKRNKEKREKERKCVSDMGVNIARKKVMVSYMRN